MNLGLDTKTVENSFHRQDPLACLFFQALNMHLRMPLVLGCIDKDWKALEFCHIGNDRLRMFLNQYPGLAFALYTLNIQHTRVGVRASSLTHVPV